MSDYAEMPTGKSESCGNNGVDYHIKQCHLPIPLKNKDKSLHLV